MSAILVGCDPEVFVKRNGVFNSAFNLIKGTKEKPFKVRNGAVQVDGMALEFNINPAKNEKQFIHNVQDVYAQLCNMVPDYEVVAVPVAHFGKEYMEQQPKEALMLGCDPDFNGWNMAENPRPDGERTFRTASGHVHIGWGKNFTIYDYNHQLNCAAAARQLDFYLGLPSLFYDSDVERRELYGKAGAYRIKPYGVEYRTLSNAWLLNEKRMGWVYRNAVKGIQEMFAGNHLCEKWGDIQDIINTSDKERALEIITAENIEVCNG